jgi:hypothetical protein
MQRSEAQSSKGIAAAWGAGGSVFVVVSGVTCEIEAEAALLNQSIVFAAVESDEGVAGSIEAFLLGE